MLYSVYKNLRYYTQPGTSCSLSCHACNHAGGSFRYVFWECKSIHFEPWAQRLLAIAFQISLVLARLGMGFERALMTYVRNKMIKPLCWVKKTDTVG